MIRILKMGDVPAAEIFDRGIPTVDVGDVVADIIRNVRKRGDAALFDEVLHQFADLVVREGGDDRGVHSKALVQAADDIVLAAAFPCAEASCGADPALARIQAEHNLAQGNGVKFAVFSVSEIQFHEYFLL